MKKIWNSIAGDLWIVILDIIAINASYFLALLVRFYVNFQLRPVAESIYLPVFVHFAPFYTVLSICIFVLFRLYGGMWRYAGINDMNRIIGANLCTAVLQIIATWLFFSRMPITYYIIGAILQFAFVVLIRFGYRMLLVEKKKIESRAGQTIPTLIIGAGETGRRAIKHFENHTAFKPVAVLETSSAGKTLDGVPVVGGELKEILKEYKIQSVCIADTKLDPEAKKMIRDACENLDMQDFTGHFSNLGGRVSLTSLLEIAKGSVTIVIDGEEKSFGSGEEAMKSITERFDVVALNHLNIELKKPAAGNAYEQWMEKYQAETGEDISVI